MPSRFEYFRPYRRRELSVAGGIGTSLNTAYRRGSAAGSADLINARRQRGRRGAICHEGSISFFNKFFLMLNDRISLLSNRGIRAPRVLNFMNSLNVSIEYPLSPFTEEPSIGPDKTNRILIIIH